VKFNFFSGLQSLMRDLNAGLNGRLTFDDQFNTFLLEDETIANGATAEIVNRLMDVNGNKIIPSQWWVVDSVTNGGPLFRGATAWTKDFLYLKNGGSAGGTFTVRFFE